jgi:hypothetical protein
MRKHQFFSLAASLLAGGLLSVAKAQDTPAPTGGPEASAAKTEKPKGATGKRALSDPAFKKFVNIRLMMPAFHARDASLLTDLALQLAFGESVLDRPHKGFTAKDMATLALATATETGDKASLERLAKFAAKTNDSQMAASISVAKLQASKTRADAPPFMLPLGNIKLGTIDYIQGVTGSIESAKILGNRAQLEALVEELQKEDGLSTELRGSVMALATDALKMMPTDATPSAAALALEKMLRSTSRQDDDDDDQGGGGGAPPDDFTEHQNAQTQSGDDGEDDGGEDQAQFFNRNRSRTRRPAPSPPPRQENNGARRVRSKSLLGFDIWLNPGDAVCRQKTCGHSTHPIGHAHTDNTN